MAAEVISSRVVPELGQEIVTIMDDFGTEFVLQLKVSDSANRQLYIDAALAQQTANQTALEDYAVTHSKDLSAQKAAGITKKNTAKEGTK